MANAASAQNSTFAYVLSVDVGWPDTTWEGARQVCQQNGLAFAAILSEADQTRMRYKLRGFKEARQAGIYTATASPDCGNNDIAAWPCGMWIGGSDKETEGTWKWSNGQKFSNYGFGGFDNETGSVRGVYPWGNKTAGASDDEPNDFCNNGGNPGTNNCGGNGSENCVRLDLEYSEGLWNDISCAITSPFVCELDLDGNRGGAFTAQSPSPPPTPPAPPSPPPPSPPPPAADARAGEEPPSSVVGESRAPSPPPS